MRMNSAHSYLHHVHCAYVYMYAVSLSLRVRVAYISSTNAI